MCIKGMIAEDEKLKDALLKKALGFDTEEVIEEYQETDEEMRLVKRKITRKNVPPDITAIKLLFDGKTDVADLTDEELQKEKVRLLKLLEKIDKGDKYEENQKS